MLLKFDWAFLQIITVALPDVPAAAAFYYPNLELTLTVFPPYEVVGFVELSPVLCRFSFDEALSYISTFLSRSFMTLATKLSRSYGTPEFGLPRYMAYLEGLGYVKLFDSPCCGTDAAFCWTRRYLAFSVSRRSSSAY